VTGSRRVRRIREQNQMAQEVAQTIGETAVGYIRVSTEDQANNGHGLKAQREAIEAFAKSQGYELLDVIIDAGVSGATRPEEREGFQRILELAETKAFSVLLVWRFDRLARSLVYAVTTANLLQEEYGVVLRSVTEPIDTSTPMGQTVFAILAGMAAQERQAIIQRTLAGKREKARRGGFAGGPAPYGYRRDRDGGLEVDPDEAQTIRRIYSMRHQGMSYRAIADVLNGEGIPTKRGGRWYAGTVRYILDNPKYRGAIEYYFRFDGEAHVLENGQHEPILPQ
jgi:site-specific DNA recombinase